VRLMLLERLRTDPREQFDSNVEELFGDEAE
jgi:hypothetical protein